VLEPIFEADFLPCSYGFRPNRRAHDAVAELRYLATRPRCYDWVVEGDIKACFDEIDHTALMGRVRRRVGDTRVQALVKAFLKAGILPFCSKNRSRLRRIESCCLQFLLNASLRARIMHSMVWGARVRRPTPCEWAAILGRYRSTSEAVIGEYRGGVETREPR
jgi:Reverse transcriptase (RNA-dependent DNA polymerase)